MIHELAIVYHLPGMENCPVQRDIIYKTAGETDLALDVYTPPGLPEGVRRPGVLLVHGGPLVPERPMPKEWAAFRSYGQLLAASGMIGIAFNYRFDRQADARVSMSDIRAAIEYLAIHQAELGLAAYQLGVWIFSGGGRFLPAILESGRDWITKIAMFYPLLDFSPQAATWMMGELANLPVLVARAGKDSQVLNRALDGFVERMGAAGAPFEMIDYAQGHHGFDLFDDNSESKRIIARAITFFQETLA